MNLSKITFEELRQRLRYVKHSHLPLELLNYNISLHHAPKTMRFLVFGELFVRRHEEMP